MQTPPPQSRNDRRASSATRERLAADGIVIRDLPATPYLRASVGAWNDERDLERLLEALPTCSSR